MVCLPMKFVVSDFQLEGLPMLYKQLFLGFNRYFSRLWRVPL